MEKFSPDKYAETGNRAYREGDFQEAERAFAKAAAGFSEQDDVLRAAEMANNRSVVLLKAGRPQEALEAAQDTDFVFETNGDIQRQAMAIGNQAAAMEALDQRDQALTNYQRCADLLTEIGDHELRVSVMQSISALQMRSGRYMEAIATMQDGLVNLDNPNLRQRILKKLLSIPINLLSRNKPS